MFYTSDHIQEFMGTKRKINKIREENKNKIVSVLDKNPKGLTRTELRKKVGIKNRRILRHHLKRLGPIITVAKDKYGKNRVYLTSHYNRTKSENLQIHQAWTKIANDFILHVKQHGLIPDNADAGEFFSKNIIMMIPQKTKNGFKTIIDFYPVERFFSKRA